MSLETSMMAAVKVIVQGHHDLVAKLNGVVVPGTTIDPVLFSIIMGQIMAASPADLQVDMRGWSLHQWKPLINQTIAAAESELQQAPDAPAVVTIPKPPVKERQQPVSAAPSAPAPPLPPMPPIVSAEPPEEPPEWLQGAQREAWIQARTRAGELCRGLGNYVAKKTGNLVAELWNGDQIVADVDPAERQRMIEVIREGTANALANNWTPRQLAQHFGRLTGDWARNWLRIARTEIQAAYNEGVVIHALKRWGAGVRIARVPNVDACPSCRRLFLDDESKPRIFTAVELVNNGTNANRSQRQWAPTVYPLHPNCRCDTQVVPDGFVFDRSWGLVRERANV